jgi:hypothetical protein
MNVGRFLKDEARRVYWLTTPGGDGSLPGDDDEWIDGEPVTPDDDGDGDEEPGHTRRHGPWFKALLTIQQPRQFAPSGRGVYVPLEGDAELMIGVRDAEGNPFVDAEGEFRAFGSDDRIEVRSKQLGTAVWEVNTGVEPLRTVRGPVVGWRVGLKRYMEPEVES